MEDGGGTECGGAEIDGREKVGWDGEWLGANGVVKRRVAEGEDGKCREKDVKRQMQGGARRRIEAVRLERQAARLGQLSDVEDEDDDSIDDTDVEVEYRS